MPEIGEIKKGREIEAEVTLLREQLAKEAQL